MKKPTVRVVTFDGDGTLWDAARLIDFALERVQEELRRLLPGEFSASLTVAELARVREELVAELSGRPTTSQLEEVRFKSFERILEQAEPRPCNGAESR